MTTIWLVGDQSLRDRFADGGAGVVVSDSVSALDDQLADASADSRPGAVVVDDRVLSEDERTQLRQVVARCAVLDVEVSVLFGQLRDEDIRDIVYGAAIVDQAVEIRSDADLDDAVTTIVEHARNRQAVAGPDDIPVGSLYPVDRADYQAARRRSLVSQRMRNFSAELRNAVSSLRQFPLRDNLPWDPTEMQPTRVNRTAKRNDLVWSKTAVPNLSEVFEHYDSVTARGLLDGTMGADDQWRNAWSGNPPAILLTGESGTGKTLVADVLGDLLIPRGSGPRGQVVKVNCASLTRNTFDHLAMGSAPGRWSGIEAAVVGHFAQAAHGVLFLDELGDLSPEVQTALLTFLDDRLVRPTGIHPFPSFMHIVAATNRDVDEGVNQQWFRNDLLARFPLRLEIPPLRGRGPDEIRRLVDFLVQDPHHNPDRGDRLSVDVVSEAAMAELAAGTYPDGNFRELTEIVHNALRRAIARRSIVLDVEDLHPRPKGGGRFRADHQSHTVSVVAVPEASTPPVIEVGSGQDLRVLARREGRAILVDGNRDEWVVTAQARFVHRRG